MRKSVRARARPADAAQASLDRRRVRLGRAEDFRYIVTEYFPSGSLELRIRNLMTVKDTVDIFLQIAGALVVVHSAGCATGIEPGTR